VQSGEELPKNKGLTTMSIQYWYMKNMLQNLQAY
jgi:hypothetical protein